MDPKRVTEQAREGVGKSGAGDPEGKTLLEQAEKTSPETIEAVEQEAADGPEGRGLAR